jgi:hypothetical protein
MRVGEEVAGSRFVTKRKIMKLFPIFLYWLYACICYQ